MLAHTVELIDILQRLSGPSNVLVYLVLFSIT